MSLTVKKINGNLEKWSFRPMAVLLVGQKCSHTGSMLRFLTFSRLALERKSSFFKVP